MNKWQDEFFEAVDLNNLNEEVYLNFVVHAIQKTKDVETVYDAWAIVN